jgi:hypothetical protein
VRVNLFHGTLFLCAVYINSVAGFQHVRCLR